MQLGFSRFGRRRPQGGCLLAGPLVALMALMTWAWAGAAWAQHPTPGLPTGLVVADTFWLDSLTPQGQLSRPPVAPGSMQVWLNGRPLPPAGYIYQAANARIWAPGGPAYGYSLIVRYQTWPAGPPRHFARPDPLLPDPAAEPQDTGPRPPPPEALMTPWQIRAEANAANAPPLAPQADSGAWRQRGRLSRAVTVGSGQDPALLSDFRLELEGQPSPDLKVTAVIADANLPLPASGQSQRITDLDRLFIRFDRGPSALTIGDLEVEPPESRFAGFYRNVLGGSLLHHGQRHQWGLVAGVAKGSFHSNAFQGENGRQGPYRLTGPNGERFLVILAGSEHVFVNGQPMTRGFDRDYVLDYQTGELTFTANRLISNADRIVVDFEYANRSYARSLLHGRYTADLLPGKLNLQLLATREADDPNAPLDRTLGADERARLATLGDASGGFTSGIDTVGWDARDVRYRLADTLVPGLDGLLVPDTILVFSTDSALARYRATFTYVGPNQGHYRKAQSTANGVVYEWVAPAGGQLQGAYEPVRPLVLPQSKVVYDLRLRYTPAPGWRAQLEAAVSDHDRNRFSPQDEDDNLGLATQATLNADSLRLAKGLRLAVNLTGRWVDDRFTNLDRVQAVEYNRVWNEPRGQLTNAQEAVAQGQLALWWRETWGLALEAGRRWAGDSSQTWRQELTLTGRDSSTLAGEQTLTWLQTDNPAQDQRTTWWRTQGEWLTRQGAWTPGLKLWAEDRRTTTPTGMAPGAFRFGDATPYLRWAPSPQAAGTLSVNLRHDAETAPNESANTPNALVAKAWAVAPSLSWQATPTPNLNLRQATTWRRYRVLGAAFRQVGERDEDVLVNNLSANYRAPKLGLSATTVYDLLSERATRLDLTYLEVPAGQGQYEWVDFNNDGLQQVAEFQRSTNPLTANYIRLTTPTDDLVPAVGMRLAATFRWDLATWLRHDSSRWARWLKPLSFHTTYRAQEQRSTTGPWLPRYLPRFGAVQLGDTTVLQVSRAFRQGVTLFRGNAKGELGLAWQTSTALQTVATGGELRRFREAEATQRWTFNRSWQLNNRLSYHALNWAAQNDATRWVDLQGLRLRPEVTYTPSSTWQLRAHLAAWTRQHLANPAAEDPALAGTDATLWAQALGVEARLDYGRRRHSFRAELEGRYLSLSGQPTPTARFELLESLEAGANLLVNLQWTHHLADQLELNVVYDGRVASGRPPQHTLRMQLKALL